MRNAKNDWNDQAKLTASDGAACDTFRDSIGIYGDTVFVGANNYDDKGSGSGSAYIFVRNAASDWSKQPKLTANDGAADDNFGWSVGIYNNTKIIGAPAWVVDEDSSAYVFSP